MVISGLRRGLGDLRGVWRVFARFSQVCAGYLMGFRAVFVGSSRGIAGQKMGLGCFLVGSRRVPGAVWTDERGEIGGFCDGIGGALRWFAWLGGAVSSDGCTS